jgi:hypothetical protein
MMDIINIVVQVAMFFMLIGMIYAIVQVVDVIREERDRLMWYRQSKDPVRTDKEADSDRT